MLIGYARVSTLSQSLDSQLDELVRAGVDPERIYVEKVSGTRDDRAQLAEALKALRAGDTLVVTKLDRLARSLRQLLDLLERIERLGANLKSLGDPIDTTTPIGKVFFAVRGAFAEFERNVIRERTQAGLAAARARGRTGGRPSKLTGQTLAAAQQLWRNPEFSVEDLCRQFKVSRRTLFRVLGPRDSSG